MLFGIDIVDAAIGAAVFAAVIFKWPQVAVWTNAKCAQAWNALKIWRGLRKQKKDAQK